MKTLLALTAFCLAITSPYLKAERDSVGRDMTNSGVDILLITSPDLAEAWQKFANWKTSLGMPTSIITTESIDKQFDGKDLQEKMRLCVQSYIKKHKISAVVLGGDSSGDGGIVPDRDTIHENMWGKTEDIPTDIYYLSPTSWDADGDGIYGEFEDDRDAITYPDGSVGIGRIPVRTEGDVIAYSMKAISYLTEYPEDDFATQMVYTCTVPQAYNKLATSWNDHVSKAWDGGAASRFFVSESPWDGEKKGDFDLTPKNLIDMINEKSIGKLHLHGHGLRHCWVLEDHKQFTHSHVQKLKNVRAYPIITTVSCFTGQFDAEKDPCIAESMLRRSLGGAVAIVAPAREGKPHFHNPRKDFTLMVKEGKPDGTTMTMAKFWVNGLGEGLPTGRALATTKAGMRDDAVKSANFHMCLCELNLLGDPTLPFRASAPVAVDATYAEDINPGEQEFTIKSKHPGATVCLSRPGDFYKVTTTDREGNAIIKISPDSRGSFTVSISGLGLNAHTGIVYIRPQSTKR